MIRLFGTSLIGILTMAVATRAIAQSSFTLTSPDKKIEVKVTTEDRLQYDVSLDGKPLLKKATIGLKIDGATLGDSPQVSGSSTRSVDQTVEPVVRQKNAKIREQFNELHLDFKGNYAVTFRAFDNGVAYRLETSLPAPEVTVYDETVGLNFADDYWVYYAKEEDFFSHNERQFLYLPLKQIGPADLASLPAVIDTKQGTKIALGESDISDYPGLWLRGTRQSTNGLNGAFPPYPLKEELSRDRDFKVTKGANYIAKTKGTRTYPWRILGIARHDGDLITNQLVYLLAKPTELKDTSWIKPGKVAWDWYNFNNIYGVDFKAGVNTQTYKYYIDFASKYGLEYIILDEGWYKLGNLLEVSPDMDVDELVRYGKQKNVGVILWCVAKTLDDQFEPAMSQFEKWGIKGIKVDFMQRDDQKLMNYYEKVCREAAKRKMLVDFHGVVRTATMTRTYPNLISTEGVNGLEQNKWCSKADPEHNVTLPFTRMFLGPMDYTPGAMLNASKAAFTPIFNEPMSLGTRCHQLAMYVVFESPLQMLADNPSNYLREPEIMEFLGPVPSVWDETRVLDAKLGDYVLIARRSGRDWYVGGMTDWTPRELTVDCSFLPTGEFQMQAYQDGANADRHGADYKKVKSSVTNTTKLQVKLAEGGGWAARITPTNPEGKAAE